jgi:acetyl esterase
MRVFAALLAAVDRQPLAQLRPEQIVAARVKRERLAALPGSQLIVGRPDPGSWAADSTIELPEGVVLPVRIHRPVGGGATRLPVVLNFHGGGFVGGDSRQSEWWCSSIAAQAGVVVVSVDYRLAPESPFPGPPEDCYAATVWAVAHADELGVDASRLAVMGDSAGGNLAAAVCLMARDRSGPAIALQVLVYPAVEMVEKFASEAENAHAPILSARDVDGFSRLYLAGGDGADPRWSPLRGEHHGLPAALIQTAQHDPLRDQGAAYAAALRSAGVATRLSNYVDAVHGFISLPGLVPVARQALAEAVAELEAALRG